MKVVVCCWEKRRRKMSWSNNTKDHKVQKQIQNDDNKEDEDEDEDEEEIVEEYEGGEVEEEKEAAVSMLGEMKRMPMNISTSISSRIDNKNPNAIEGITSRQKKSGGMLIVLVSATFVVFFLLTYMVPTTNKMTTLNTLVVERPEEVGHLLELATERGLQSHSLIPIFKSDSETIIQDSIPFITSFMKEPRLRSREKTAKPVDPFAQETMDMTLFVTYVPPMHTLVLNKFPSYPNHAILTTNQFTRQNIPLTIEDFDAWYWTLSSIDGFGFYNSDPLSGSSQPHKHVQLIPRSSLHRKFQTGTTSTISETDGSTDLPVESLIFPHLIPTSSNYWAPFNPFHPGAGLHNLEEYHFSHGLLILSSEEDWLRSQEASIHRPYSEYLFTAYHFLLETLGLATKEFLLSSPFAPLEVSYNLLLTPKWMMIIPRSFGNFKGLIDINGMGFYGMLLFRNESALSFVRRETGLMAVLEGVGKKEK